MHMTRRMVILVALGVCASLAAAVNGQVVITSAGATFPMPLYQTMIAQFMQKHPNVKINYGGGGSGQGIKGITDKTLAFAGSDAPMRSDELKAAGGADAIIEFPTCAGAVVPAYNVPGVQGDLNFSGDVLGNIYLGKINNWNDPEIAAVNPGVTLPNLPMVPAWRSDSSGTNFVWTSYLSKKNKVFSARIGAGKQVHFLVGQGGIQNAGVAAIVQTTPGAIGYIEQNYAELNHIQFGLVQNNKGKFIKASTDAVTLAAASAANDLKGNVLHASIWDEDGDGVYPISSLTYLIAYKDLSNLRSREEAQAVVDFFWFVTHGGQGDAVKLYYAPLGDQVQKKVEAALGQFIYKNQAIQPQP